MGIETVIAITASVAISIGLSAYAMISMPRNKNKLQKANLDSLSVTQAQEGAVIPIAYGKVKLAGNIVWYGNIKHKNIPAQGGKGFGGGTNSGQYRVYADVQFVLALGVYTLDDVFFDEEDYDYSTKAAITFNDGSNGLYVAYDTYASALPGVCHIHFQNWYLGDNQASVPNLQFIITRDLSHLPAFAASSTTNGANPASIIYDLLLNAGFSASDVDQAAWASARDYWNLYDYGLNLVFSEQQDLTECIRTIFSHVDAVMYRDVSGKFVLKALREDEASAATIAESDLLDFTFSREAYNQVNTDFTANYLDADFKERTCRIVNEAAIALTGRRQVTYDFPGFRTETSVSKRLCEIVKRESYPRSQVSLKLPIKYSQVVIPGSVFALSYTAWGLTSKYFRCTQAKKLAKENAIEIQAKEHTHQLFDFYSINGAGTLWNDPDITLDPLDDVAIVEMFKTQKYNQNAVCVLAVRKKGIESAYDIYVSPTSGSGYTYLTTRYTFAEVGELKEQYSSNTYELDDQIGILVDFVGDTAFLSSLTRAELFTTKRFLVIGNEFIKYQTTAAEGLYYRFSGCLRDKYSMATHAIGSKVYFCELGDNVLTEFPPYSPMYFKIVPKTLLGIADISSVTEVSLAPEFLPRPVSRIVATRAGSDVAVSIWPCTNNFLFGCGLNDADEIVDTIPHPFVFSGTFLLNDGTNDIIVNDTQTTITKAGAFTLTVYNLFLGRKSAGIGLDVGSGDGEYVV